MADPPPSYNEVVNNATVQRDQPSANPSAPRLEDIAKNLPHPHNPQGQLSQPAYIQDNGRFSAWDDTATEILIMNRLEMNERFERAQNQQERNEFWNVILNNLLSNGYSFALIDLMQYWDFEFYIYKSIINSLSAGTQADTSWKYFQPMDNVFQYSSKAMVSKTSNEGYEADASPVINTFGGLTNLGSIRDALPPNPLLKFPVKNNDVVTDQPRSTALDYSPTAPGSNRYDDDDVWCCCCPSKCCGESPSYPYTAGRTGGYSSNNDYIPGGYTNNFTSGYTDNDNHCLTSDCTSGDNSCVISGDNGCCDTGGAGTNDGCHDTGGTHHSSHDTSGTHHSSHDTNGTHHSSHDNGDTHHNSHDTGGSDTYHSSHDTGGGYDGGGYDGGCDSGGGDDGGCDGGGGDD